MNEDKGNVVYILINAAMPGYVKIGRTKDLSTRMKSLYRTPVPLPFECFYACEVDNGSETERWLFNVFEDRRVSREREFFKIAPERVAVALKVKEVREITPNKVYTENEGDKLALNKAQKRRERFNFKMVDIKPGAVLQFSMDESIVCTVIDDRKVEFKNEAMSLTEAALRVLKSKDIHWKAVSGPGIWEYEGESLHERRLRIEEKNEREIEEAGDYWTDFQNEIERGR